MPLVKKERLFFAGRPVADGDYAEDGDDDADHQDPLALITTYMTRKYMLRDADSQEFGRRKFYLIKLARNIAYHGNETPREMALLISASLESALLIQELYLRSA